MHPFSISAEAKARLTARLGRDRVCERFAAARTALLVVDMQNYFMSPGFQLETPVAREIVPGVNRLASGLRAAGGIVVWIENRSPQTGDEPWPTYEARHSAESWQARQRDLTPGSAGFALGSGLVVDPADLRIGKTRFSAFIQGASDLEAELRGRGIDTVLIAGVATNICCESTARDAMMRNFTVCMVSDACAAPTDEEHAASLTNLYLYFCDVQTVDEVLARVEPARAAAE